MSDQTDTRLRQLTYRLIAMAPEAPPFPEDPMVQLKPSPTTAPAPRRRSPLLLVAGAAVLVVLIVGVPLILFGSGDEPGPTTIPPATTTTTADTSTTTSTVFPGTELSFFSVWLNADDTTTRFGDPALVPVLRSSQLPVDVAGRIETRLEAALTSLVAGSVPAGFTTAIPAGITSVSVSVDGDVVTVDLPAAFESGGGSSSMFARLRQVVFTATQFPEVEAVVFAIDGQPIDVFSSEGIVLDGPQRRADFYDDAQAIYVDTPAVGTTITSPYRISGVANVFEATLQYELVTDDGDVLDAGFTTATCGTGCWGDFEIAGTYGLAADTTGHLDVFTLSAEDGSRDIVIRHAVRFVGDGPEDPTTTTEPQPAETLPPVGALSFDVDPATVSATASDGEVVLDAVWGTTPDRVGRDEVKGFGPCCFDVTDDGTIVLLDAQNLRLVVHASGAAPRVLATFDPADFVAENLAVMNGRVYVVGLSNRPQRPYDLVVLDLDNGTQLSRVETSLEINTDLRVTSDGEVYAGVMSSRPTWVQLTVGGEPVGAAAEQRFDFLPGETSVSVTYDAGIEIVVQPAGDTGTTTFDVPTDQFVLDVIPVPGSPDANGVLVPVTAAIGGGDPVTLLFLGSDQGELSVDALSIDMPRDAELGTFNTIRYGYGGVYVMSSTTDGIRITRYELP